MAIPAHGAGAECGDGRKPLSQTIADLLASKAGEPLTLNRLLDRMEERGVYLVIIVLCVPFVVPVSLPGLSLVMGGIISILLLGIVFGKRAHFPRFLGDRVFPPTIERRILAGSVSFLRWIEKFVRPRRTQWLSWRIAEITNALILLILALLLALPLPSPPFFLSNTFPGCAIILIAASIMERDGLFIWVGYAAAVFTGLFFCLIGGGVAQLILKCWHALSHSTTAL
jgi:hypothetical protein